MNLEKEYSKFLVKLSENIKALRLEHGYTQEEMVQFGFNYRHYQKLESGTHSPSLSTLFKISKLYKITLSDLFDFKS